MDMNPLIQKSPYAGTLVKETVKGTASGMINPENNIETTTGADRTMYVYVPVSGCPHPKQCAVLYVLRDENTEQSAFDLLKKLKLDELAEEKHFIVLFPDPMEEGWNYNNDEKREDDCAFLARCFAALPVSKGRVSGFNGMMYYIGSSTYSSALLMRLSERSPLDAAAVMIGALPEDFNACCLKAGQSAWVYDSSQSTLGLLCKGTDMVRESDRLLHAENNPVNQVIFDERQLNSETVRECWEQLFADTRRWRSDTYGTYQPRIDFEKRGFIPHYQDKMLSVNGGFAHTWYEYVPESAVRTGKKLPLVFFFHGINCVPLYGAEQSGWADIADEEGFACVFPEASIENRWNVWDDPRLPSDVQFIMALADHMKKTYSIDPQRIYISGFSMGALFTNALASAYPDIFAASAPFNGPNWGYFTTLDAMRENLMMFRRNTVIRDLPACDETVSPIRKLADEKKNTFDYRMPVIQTVGLLDNMGFERGGHYPLCKEEGNDWVRLIRFWQNYNHIDPSDPFFHKEYSSGLNAVQSWIEKERFLHQLWKDGEGNDLYHFVSVSRMPHAVDYKGIRIAWDFMKHYCRMSDGTIVHQE